MSRRPAAVLLDIDGVLVVGDRPVPGAIQALDWIRETGISFRCVTNGTRRSRATIAARLADFGFPTEPKDIFSPAIAAVRRIRGVGADSCHLVSTGDVHLDLLNGGCRLVDSDTPFVVVGDAAENWTYGGMNRAYRLLLDGACLPVLEVPGFSQGPQGQNDAAGGGVERREGASETLSGKALQRPSQILGRRHYQGLRGVYHGRCGPHGAVAGYHEPPELLRPSGLVLGL